MKGRATSSENRKHAVVIVASAFDVVQKMLTNGGLVKLLRSSTVGFTCAGKILTVFTHGGGIANRPWYVLFDAFLQALRRATNVPTIAVALKLINQVAMLMGR